MNKTFYIPDREKDLIEKAEEISDKSFSSLCLDLIRDYVSENSEETVSETKAREVLSKVKEEVESVEGL